MPLFEVNETNGIPIWVQLRNRFVYLIESGFYSEGDKLPTVRLLASELQINYHTVNKVYTSLEYEGYIATKRGKGTFVCKVDPDGEKSAERIIMEECIRQCSELGMTYEEIEKEFLAALKDAGKKD